MFVHRGWGAMDLFTKFEGRISRRRFWLGFVGIAAMAMIAGLGIMFLLPEGTVLVLGQVLLSGAIVYMWSAVVVKRLHDRGKPALPWVVIFMAPGVIMQVMSILKIGYSAVELGGTSVMVPGVAAMAVMWAAMAVALWMIVELGFLKGTQGDNTYGPDPLRTMHEAQAT